MRPATNFLNPQNIYFFYKDFVIPIEVIYPDWDNLSRFGDILSLMSPDFLWIFVVTPKIVSTQVP